MRFGIVILPEHRWSVAEPMWRQVEELGFDTAWTYDHLSWPGLMDSPWYGTMPTLAAAAVVTSRVKLGTFVTTPNFRHPLPLARDLMALDDISGGRFVCGIGAGGGFDQTVLGGPELNPRQSVDRLADFLALLDELLTTDHVNHDSEYFTTRDARTLPGSVQRPRVPFLVAANGPRSLNLARQFGTGWVTTGRRSADPTTWWQGIGDLAARLDDDPTPPPSFERHVSLDSGPTFSLSSVGTFSDLVTTAAELGFTDVITHWPRPDGPYAGDIRTLEAVARDVLPRYR
jgi:alkanesulfonate monooxygenase SsuD/methylene tetrahydromethanopterin reductase-like flavin-dependent oxidoreductase (luciferase family)